MTAKAKYQSSVNPSAKMKWLLGVGFWSVIILMAVGSQLARISTPECRNTILQQFTVAEFPDYAAWAILSPVILWLGGRLSLDQPHRTRKIALLFALGLFICMLQAIPQEIINVMSDVSVQHEKSLSHSLRFHILPTLPVKFLIFSAILGMGYAFDYYKRYQERTARLGQLEKQLVQAKLDALKAQLHPHFLFNTLNTISALVERDPGASRRMIARLSELLRLTMDRRDQQEVTLEQELRLLQHYLEIEQIRFHDRLKVDYNVTPKAKKALVPNMILQPLVENAIRHGISQRRSGGKIRISAELDNGMLTMTVEDDGPGINATRRVIGKGVGLENTRSRLAQLYGEKHQLELIDSSYGGLAVRFSFPLHKKPTNLLANA